MDRRDGPISMKQVLQNLKTGETVVENVPCPRTPHGHLLIRTACTLVSTGTERMLVDFGKANLIDKARQQPDKVKEVLDKVRTDGLAPTVRAVRHKLDQPLPMGYCNVGVVVDVGTGVDGFDIGDRVVSNGWHAEFVAVPKNLCAKMPAAVSDEDAAFTVIGAIALQGLRLAGPTLGESFVVTGLGLIGLIAIQLLKANGCRVLGIDVDPTKISIAKQLGAETVDLSSGQDPIKAAHHFSRGRGVDGVLITASTTSNEPVHQAAVMCRKRGRIVLIGVVGLELSRSDFYQKELSFQVSCSYGPGRYDTEYEDKGHDYPVGYVRWSEQRNFEAVLDMMSAGRLSTAPLISHRFDLTDAAKAYDLMTSGSPLGIILQIPKREPEDIDQDSHRTVRIKSSQPSDTESPVRVGFIGAGNYATQILIPAFADSAATLHTVACSRGVSGVHAAKKFGIRNSTTSTEELIESPDINTVVVATRHDSHARYACAALRAGKHVFVEKPLAIHRDELAEIESAYEGRPNAGTSPILMVGFNRRFAPQIKKIKALLENTPVPKSFIMTVNAGAVPGDSWTQDRAVGGGRIIGEGCHFVDLLRFLAAAPITKVQAMRMGGSAGTDVCDDKVSIQLAFKDGSLGTVHYLANGHKSFPKERLEVFCGESILQLDNFRKLRGYNWPGFRKMNLFNQDKGHRGCVTSFVEAVMKSQPSPIPFDQLIEVTRTCFDIVEQITEQ